MKDNINNIEQNIKNIEEWNNEHANIKPILEVAVDYHNKARREACWKNYEKASEFFKKAIENYRSALKLNPKYYLQDIIERVDFVIGEYLNSMFNFKISDDRLRTKQGAKEFVEFVENLSPEEDKYIDRYDMALGYFKIGNICNEDGDFDKAYELFNRAVNLQCDRPFLNRDAYFKMGQILLNRKRFKEALMSFISVLSFDKGNMEAVNRIDICLKELKISEHRFKFLSMTPNEAKKLIMEVL
ncbi:MAG: tetratricopeptide repeat protein [Candidatus Omnitrophica bacterium]|nr:tetratricopeptide repeat protein [Candidatus Omnitrophota bacterium]